MHAKVLTLLALLAAAGCGDLLRLEPKTKLPVEPVEELRFSGDPMTGETTEEPEGAAPTEEPSAPMPGRLVVTAPERRPEVEPAPRRTAVIRKTRRSARMGPRIRVIERGREPREPLRLDVRTGHRETMEMVTRMTMEISTSEQSIPKIKLPPVSITMDVRVTDVDEDGNIHFSVAVSDVEILDDPSVQKRVMSAMKGSVADMEGFRGEGVMTDRGIALSATFHAPPNASAEVADFIDQLKQNAGRMSAPLPEEPVGEGAIWEVHMMMSARGVEFAQVARYQLLKRDPNGVKILVTLEQMADRQRVRNSQVPRGTVMMLEKLSGKGQGRIVFRPDRLVPVAQMNSETSFGFSMAGRGQSETMDMTLGLDLSINPDQGPGSARGPR